MSTAHPGKTEAQRRALDAIGCGNYSPVMAKSTRSALLKAGLIEECGYKTIGRGPFAVRVYEYSMPISVHMQWCRSCSDDGPIAAPALERTET